MTYKPRRPKLTSAQLRAGNYRAQQDGDPRSYSFVISNQLKFHAVDWLVARSGYRTFMVGKRTQDGAASRVYCHETMSNADAERVLLGLRALPELLRHPDWEWNVLDDWTTPADSTK